MKVFLDPGHNPSGGDTGAQGNGMREQDVTYRISAALAELLRRRGLDVKLSRSTIASCIGTTLAESINGRSKMANDWGADFFISIHCNAHTSTAANGTETLTYQSTSAAFSLAKLVNARLAGLGLTNRGVKIRTDLGVLRQTKMPAILVETAFISNPSDALFLSERQSAVAAAIAEGFLAFAGIRSAPSIEDVTNEMLWRGIITNRALWNEKAAADEDIRWLFEKYYPYILENDGSVKDRRLSPTEAVAVLARQKILSETAKWLKKATEGRDDILPLVINMADYIN